MRTNQAVRSAPSLVDKPEIVGPALANIVRVDESGRDLILGQAWLASSSKLVTAGHVVDQYVNDLRGMQVFFPHSGKRYPIQQIQLHPSFVRQPDGLVRFDVAALSAQMPDLGANPLPFTYEVELRTNQRLWTIRYPVHLGQFSPAPQPLSQDGHYLGLLRKHDSFHLLHDVPLAPGDSGAPIFDGRSVVAIHCGDTATLPGLNLPTTSIRLALWVDALRELGLRETRKSYGARASRIAMVVGAFVLTFAIAFGVGLMALFAKPHAEPTAIKEPAMLPVLTKFNKAPNDYVQGEAIEITLVTSNPVYPFVFVTDQAGHVAEIFPPAGKIERLEHSLTIDQSMKLGTERPVQLEASKEPVKLYVVAAKAGDVASDDWAKDLVKPSEILDKPTGALMIDEATLLKRISDFESQKPELVTLTKFDMPAAQARQK